MLRSPKKAIGVLLILVSFVFLFLHVGLTYRYSRALSRNVEPKLGRVYALNNHGTVVYMTSAEWWILWGLFDGAIFLGAVGGILSKDNDKRVQPPQTRV